MEVAALTLDVEVVLGVDTGHRNYLPETESLQPVH